MNAKDLALLPECETDDVQHVLKRLDTRSVMLRCNPF